MEGWPAVGDPTGGFLISSESVVDLVPFMGTGTDICAAIQSALSTYLSTVVTLDGRGVTGGNITCTMSPFNGSLSTQNHTALTGRLLLGAATITTSVQWTMPNTFFWIEGIAEGNKATSGKGTVIVANNGNNSGIPNFSCTNGYQPVSMTLPGSLSVCPVFFIGDQGTSATGDSFGSGIRNLAVDCEGLTGCAGAGSTNIQEGGGIDSVVFYNQVTNCVDFDDTIALGNLGIGISNSFLRNVNCVFKPTGVTSGALGIYVRASDGPAEISNTSVTVPQGSGSVISDCLDVDQAKGVVINYFHCEHASYGEVLGGATYAVTGANIHGFTNGSSIGTAGIYIQNATDVTVESVEMNTGTALKDDVNGITLSSPNVSKYVMSKAGGALITTDQSTPSVLWQERLIGIAKLSLGTPPDGTLAWCSNCVPTSGSGCPGTGSGALAVHQGGNWVCK
jgi:hypothetical protein